MRRRSQRLPLLQSWAPWRCGPSCSNFKRNLIVTADKRSWLLSLRFSNSRSCKRYRCRFGDNRLSPDYVLAWSEGRRRQGTFGLWKRVSWKTRSDREAVKWIQTWWDVQVIGIAQWAPSGTVVVSSSSHPRFIMMDIQAFHGSYAIDNRYHSHTLE